jgi:predicted membrane chloride channel (bestrophin family)
MNVITEHLANPFFVLNTVLYMFLLPAALVGTGVSLLPAIVTSTFASYVLVGIDEIGLESKFVLFVVDASDIICDCS